MASDAEPERRVEGAGDVAEVVGARVALARLGGVARRAELLAEGVQLAEVRRLVRRGELVRASGCYGVAGDEEIAERLAICARPGAVASHFTAARAHDLTVWVDKRRSDRPPIDAVWLTRPPGRGRIESGPEIVVRRTALAATDVRVVRGLPCTTPARTAIDLARMLPFREAVVVLDRALARAVPRETLAEMSGRQANWPGAASARRALAFADGRAESPLESLARVVFAEGGLPVPVLQGEIWDRDDWSTARVDFCWPDRWVIAEVDGMAKYEADTVEGRRVLRRRDHTREQYLGDLGFEVVRFTWEDVVLRPDEVCTRVRRAFVRTQGRHRSPAEVRSVAPGERVNQGLTL